MTANPLTTAILLAAGEGSRLRPSAPFKPLCRVAGKALIDHALDGLATAGLTRCVVVLGYGEAAIREHLALRARRGSGTPEIVVVTTDHAHPNGVSALAAAPVVDSSGAVLAMCDHLVDPALYRRMAEAGPGPGLRLGIDRRLGHAWVDPLDVTCVRTRGQRIEAIGKELVDHDAYDTGVFAVGPALFDALSALPDPSLSDGVRVLAAEGRAEIVDVSDLEWLDVDDPPALARAEAWRAAA
ncbi:NTP transferase domain-containing protein [Sphingomonas aerophila]|uniref:1L-myo-inositol 1-phosphate cytidylyltransferase n=1 Tax=Sphingomonas aerophila TaxID=1344948 RepID=A0A7W9BF96_9SPHN|nr:1L-myo-inositol 1-phosphate cytidylyltransferase [Sphingomonas aerophila]